jgi:mRNA-degrading endonuclease RelE of RelBE toxin-antitoxin system
MTDKISKELAKYTAKERKLVKDVLVQLRSGDTKGLNITKLKGHADIFRLRKGKIRIVYKQDNTAIKILAIEKRSEKTYRDF